MAATLEKLKEYEVIMNKTLQAVKAKKEQTVSSKKMVDKKKPTNDALSSF